MLALVVWSVFQELGRPGSRMYGTMWIWAYLVWPLGLVSLVVLIAACSDELCARERRLYKSAAALVLVLVLAGLLGRFPNSLS